MKLQETILEIQNDFNNISKLTNEELLTNLAKIRLEQIDNKYEKEFDRLLLSLRKEYINEQDFDKLSNSLNILSSTLTTLYSIIIDHLKFYYF